jgi:hypothetical protein
MNIKYKIVSIEKGLNTYLVNFYTDIVPETDGIKLNFSLHDLESTDQDIHQRIQLSVPARILNQKEKAIKGEIDISMDRFEHLINKEFKYDYVEKRGLNNDDIDELVRKYEAKFK